MEKNTGNDSEVLFPEHEFLATCLQIGISVQDLKILTYIDVIKIFLSLIQAKSTKKIKKATQEDIDKLLM